MKRTTLPDDLGRAQSAMREILGDGEVSVFITRSKKRINTPKYVMVFTYANNVLIRKLPVKAYLLLAYLYSHVDTANIINISLADIAIDIEKHRSSVYGALKVLRTLNIVLKTQGKYYISPQICWCGSLVQWRSAMNTLNDSIRVKIPIDRRSVKINRFSDVIPINKTI